jgi:hypothetical protein
MVRHSCGLNCSGQAAEPNIGPYMPLWVTRWSSRRRRRSSESRRMAARNSALDSTGSQRTSRWGNSRRLSAARVWAARVNFGPPSRYRVV